MSTVREHLGLLWLLRRGLMTTNPQYDKEWAAQAALFVGVHLNELIELAGGADVEGWVRKAAPEIPADFPHHVGAEGIANASAGAQNAEAIRNVALAEGLEMAARHLDKQRQAVDQDHAYQEPDTGAWVFDRPETEEYSNTLAELAEEIRALQSGTATKTGDAK